MSTDTLLREAYERLAERAPGIDDLDLDVDVVGAPVRHQARVRRARQLQVALAVAAVLIVVVGVAFVARGARRDPSAASTSFVPATSLDFDATWDFGPSSLPGVSLDARELWPGVQHFAYIGPPAAQPQDALMLWMSTFHPSAAVESELQLLTPTRFGDRSGYSTVMRPGSDELHRLVQYGNVDLQRYPGAEAPGSSWPMVFWPIGGGRWAALAANSGTQQDPLSVPDLAPYASAATTVNDPMVGALKVGHVPNGLRFTMAWDFQNNPADGQPADSVYTLNARVLRIFRFSDAAGTHSLVVETAVDPRWSLHLGAGPNDLSLPGVEDGAHGPFRQTTVRGHLAYVSDNAILIDWDGVEVGLTDINPMASSDHPTLSSDELLAVAHSLTVPSDVTFGHGYPLIDCLPASAFG